ncbi:MAG: hypothetical protein VBE63_17560 [Lamprobacter sp.]|uniref:hypothetical protein n=1 Tax=Lamprobacter sp. TaxID=3100796 RepID=UPI002B263E3D|nr:hypothetical protein [Lamprobacter sp.]MEA3641725.1 hypothetical protein [Lamprobacter sp.]
MINSKNYVANCATGTVIDVRGFTRTKVTTTSTGGGRYDYSGPRVSTSVEHTDYVRFVLRHEKSDGTNYDETFVLEDGDLNFAMGDVISHVDISRPNGKKRWTVFFKNKTNGSWVRMTGRISAIAGSYYFWWILAFIYLIGFVFVEFDLDNFSSSFLWPLFEAVVLISPLPHDEGLGSILNLFVVMPLVCILPWIFFRFVQRKGRKKEIRWLITEAESLCSEECDNEDYKESIEIEGNSVIFGYKSDE